MRFSFWPHPNQPWSTVLALCQRVEAAGWDGIWFEDHFMPNEEDTSAPQLECWTTVSALAALIPRLRIGHMVLGNTYRHPAVVAKMAATVDHISGGRLILGLGGGWQQNEHRAYGLPFPDTGERLRMLDEACQVIKALFNDSRPSFSGRYYQLHNATLEPKPIQKPLPLMIGGGGEKVTLKITAKYADEWNVWGDVATLKHKMLVLDKHCAEVGRDPGEIQRSAAVIIVISDDVQEVTRIRNERQDYATIAGNVEEITAIVAQYQAAGVDELIIPDFNLDDGPEKVAFLDRFITEVAGAFR